MGTAGFEFVKIREIRVNVLLEIRVHPWLRILSGPAQRSRILTRHARQNVSAFPPCLRQKQSAAVKLLTAVARGIKEFRDAGCVVSIADFQPARQRVDGAFDRITLTHRSGDAYAKAGDFFRDGQRDRRDAED